MIMMKLQIIILERQKRANAQCHVPAARGGAGVKLRAGARLGFKRNPVSALAA